MKHLTGLFKQQAQAIVFAFNPVIHKIQGVSGEVKKLANEIESCIIQADTLAKLDMNDQQQSTDGSTIVQDVSSAVGIASSLASVGVLIAENWGAIAVVIGKAVEAIARMGPTG